MPVDLSDFARLEKEVQDLKELVEALKSENLRLSDPQPIEALAEPQPLIASIPILPDLTTFPSPPLLERSAPKKRVRVKLQAESLPTESEPPVSIPDAEPVTESKAEI
jgi:hypothetical protein